MVTYVAQRNPSLRVLFIGGGGYVMPRYLEKIHPQSTLEVIEIDPEVTRVVFEYLGLSSDSGITTYNEDARMMVPKLPEGQYDLVVGDAFNDVSVPYHLTTREFNEQIRALLKDDGIYAVNVVDKRHSGRFLRAYVNTLQRTFPYVYVICDNPEWDDDSRNTHVVAGSFQPLSTAALREANTQAGRGHPVSHVIPNDTLTSWLNAQANILLTDDYAPVDNLVASFHLEKRGLSHAEKHLNTGLKLASQGKLKEAIAEYDEAIRLNPYFAIVFNNRGLIYNRLGQFQRAIQDYDEAIRLNPYFAITFNNRGLIYAQLGQFQRAIQDYDEAIRLNPQYTMAYYNRGNAYFDRGQYEQAIGDYDEVIRLNPQDAVACYNRGNTYFDRGQYEQAIRDYDEAIRLNPQYAMAYYNRGIAYKLQDKKAEALADFEKSITLTDNSWLIEMARQQIEELSK